MKLPGEKGFAPVAVLIIIVVVLLGGVYCFSRIQNFPRTNNISNKVDTKNWKTYENKDFGISFSYPEDKYNPVLGMTFPSPINPKVFTDDLKTVPQISLESNQPKGPNDSGPLNIEKLENTTIDAWLKANSEADKAQTGSYFSVSNNTITDTTFQGYPAKLLVQKVNPETPTEAYLVQVGNNVYYISYLSDFPVATEKVYQEYNQKFDKDTKPTVKKILSSIKFH